MITAAPKLDRDRSPRLMASLGHSAAAVEEVQRLRYRVFGRELGALGGA
jgi:putative hemolysin